MCKKTQRSGSYFVVRFLMSMSGTKCPPFPSQTIPNEYCQPRGTYRLGSQTVLCPRDLTSEDQNYMEACSIPCSYSSYCQSPICVKITIGRGSIFSLFNVLNSWLRIVNNFATNMHYTGMSFFLCTDIQMQETRMTSFATFFLLSKI